MKLNFPLARSMECNRLHGTILMFRELKLK